MKGHSENQFLENQAPHLDEQKIICFMFAFLTNHCII